MESKQISNTDFLDFHYKSLKFVLFLLLIQNANGEVLKTTSVRCELQDDYKYFLSIEQCRLKAIKRDYSELTVKLNFHRLPLNSIKAQFQLLKRANGFKPFLYNVQFDACKLIKQVKYRMSFEKLLYDAFVNSTNIGNTSCPWNKPDFALDRFGLTPEQMLLPLPSGSYCVEATLTFNAEARVVGKIFFIKEE